MPTAATAAVVAMAETVSRSRLLELPTMGPAAMAARAGWAAMPPRSSTKAQSRAMRCSAPSLRLQAVAALAAAAAPGRAVMAVRAAPAPPASTIPTPSSISAAAPARRSSATPPRSWSIPSLTKTTAITATVISACARRWPSSAMAARSRLMRASSQRIATR